MLLKNVDDIIKYLGRAIMSATTDEFLQPYIEAAQEEVLVKALGPEMVAELDEEYNAAGWTSASEAKKTLLAKMQRALAWAAYLRYLPFAIGNDGDNGLQEIGTEHSKPVRIGVLDKRMRETAKNASNALESLLVYLNGHVDDFDTYKTSETYQATKKLLIVSAKELNEVMPQAGEGYAFYLTLLPYLKLAERDYIQTALGKEQFDELKDKIRTNDMTDDLTALLWHVQRALAHAAYAEAVPHLNKVVLDNGTTRVLSDFDGIYNQKSLSDEQLDKLVTDAKTEAAKHLNALRVFLKRNKSNYPLYANALVATEATPNRLPDNTMYKKTFRMR